MDTQFSHASATTCANHGVCGPRSERVYTLHSLQPMWQTPIQMQIPQDHMREGKHYLTGRGNQTIRREVGNQPRDTSTAQTHIPYGSIYEAQLRYTAKRTHGAVRAHTPHLSNRNRPLLHTKKPSPSNFARMRPSTSRPKNRSISYAVDPRCPEVPPGSGRFRGRFSTWEG